MAASSVLTLLLAFVIAGIPLYVFPSVDAPTQADAIFVLGPPSKPRVAYAEKLMDKGYAKTLVLSVKAVRTSQDFIDACEGGRAYAVSCFVAKPNTTQGEAEQLRELAQQNNWDNVIVVTFRSHVTRARVILQRCYSGHLEMVAAPKRYDISEWIYEYIYQSAAFVKVAVSPSC